MVPERMRSLRQVAGLAWLVVAAYGAMTAIADSDNWELTYTVFMLALLVGAILSTFAAARSSGPADRPRLRRAGLIISGVGGAATFTAWALPLWMTLLGVGLGMVAIASAPAVRRGLAVMAAGQLAGVAVLILLIEAEVGRQDEWGDYPVASGVAIVVTAIVMIAGLIELTRKTSARPLPETAPAIG